MDALFEGTTGSRVRMATFVVLVLLGVFLAVMVAGNIMSWRYIGAGLTATNTISVSGHGEYLAVPDTAEFTFSVVSDKAAVADAQADATAKANAVSAYLKSAGIADADIQTTDYSVTPQYSYDQKACPPGIYCPSGNQTLTGYEVNQTTTVKVHDTTKAGDLLAGVGSKGASNVSGLNFTFSDPNAVQAQARDKAIVDAKSKADALAKSLGVSLVRVVSFQESAGGDYPRPMYATMASGATDSAKSVAPDISVGQNNTTDDVTITYEIR